LSRRVHLIELVQRYGATGVDRPGRGAHRPREGRVEAAELEDRIQVFVGVLQEIPFPDGHFDFVWCRDVVHKSTIWPRRFVRRLGAEPRRANSRLHAVLDRRLSAQEAEC